LNIHLRHTLTSTHYIGRIHCFIGRDHYKTLYIRGDEKEKKEREDKISREAAAARKEKEANLTKLLDEFGIQDKDASNLAAGGVKTVEDLMVTLPEDIAAFNLSVIGKRKLEKLLDFFSGCPAHQLDAAYALFCSNQNGDYSSVYSSGRGDGSGEEDCGGTGNDAPTGAN
jgi:hypothetical protein